MTKAERLIAFYMRKPPEWWIKKPPRIYNPKLTGPQVITGITVFPSKVAPKLVGINITQATGIEEGSRDRIRELVRIRDNHTCQKCFKVWELGKRRFDVHHEDEHAEGTSNDPGACAIDRANLDKMITLCHKCHLNLPEVRRKMQTAQREYLSTRN